MIRLGKLLRIALLGAALAALMAAGASAASLGAGTVTADALRLRESASTDATILATAPEGDAVVVLSDAGGGWYKVDYKAVEGYMSGEYLDVQEVAEIDLGYGMVHADGATLNVRSGPGTDFAKLGELSSRAVVRIVGIDNGWYKIDYGDQAAYVSSDYMIPVKDSSGTRGDAPAPSELSQQIIAYAQQFMGVPYVYGANGPSSFDCSGFTKYVYAHFGYDLYRSASDQLANGTPVSMAELQPGDLVFFRYNTTRPASHVGIYLGDGIFIHASTNRYMVQTNDLTSGHYNRVFVGGRRII